MGVSEGMRTPRAQNHHCRTTLPAQGAEPPAACGTLSVLLACQGEQERRQGCSARHLVGSAVIFSESAWGEQLQPAVSTECTHSLACLWVRPPSPNAQYMDHLAGGPGSLGVCRLLQETKRCIAKGVRMRFVLNRSRGPQGIHFREKRNRLYLARCSVDYLWMWQGALHPRFPSG